MRSGRRVENAARLHPTYITLCLYQIAAADAICCTKFGDLLSCLILGRRAKRADRAAEALVEYASGLP